MKIKLNKKEQVALANLARNVAWYHNGAIGRLAERLFNEIGSDAFGLAPALVPSISASGFIYFEKRGKK